MRTLFHICVIFGTAVAFQCYQADFTQKGQKPDGTTFKVLCNTQCYKSVASTNYGYIALYNCDTIGLNATPNGACSVSDQYKFWTLCRTSESSLATQKVDKKSDNICCCSGDLCNSASMTRVSALFSLVMLSLLL